MKKKFLIEVDPEDIKAWREYMNREGFIDASVSDALSLQNALEFHSLSCIVTETPLLLTVR